MKEIYGFLLFLLVMFGLVYWCESAPVTYYLCSDGRIATQIEVDDFNEKSGTILSWEGCSVRTSSKYDYYEVRRILRNMRPRSR